MSPPKLDPSEVRDKLRKLTAYPALRKCLFAFQVIAGVAFILSVVLVIALMTMRADDLPSWTDFPHAFGGAFIGIFASLSLTFSSLILASFLDIADALLANLE